MKKLVIFLLLVPVFLNSDSSAQQAPCPVTGASSSVQYLNTTVTLKILLVEFSDVTHRTTPSAYTATNFRDLLVSSGVYVTPNVYSPDGDAVYGSLADYFRIMSNNNLTVTGFVVNNVGGNDIPIWVTLDHTKAQYANGTYSIWSDAVSAAQSQGLDVGGLGDQAKLAIIYAGNIHYSTQQVRDFLNPAEVGPYYIMSERNGSPANVENGNDHFGLIGAHCHEFAHTIGIGHSSGSRSDLMEAGRRNGPISIGSNGSGPAPLNPAHRALKGWITPTVVSGQQQFDAHYSLTAPEVFRINSNSNGDYFLVENRRFNQNMVIGSTTVPDYNTWTPICWSQNPTWIFYPEGIMVWRVIGGEPSDYSNNGLVYASGQYNLAYPDNTPTETDAGDLFPGTRNNRCLSPWSDSRDPNTTENGHYTLYVPNTKSGTNVGMQILSENSSQGYFTVLFYASNPIPFEVPQNLVFVNAQANGQRPNLSWTANGEPAVAGYNVYREYYDGYLDIDVTEQIAALYASTSYTDNTAWTSNVYSSRILFYWVTAADQSAHESPNSNEVASNGRVPGYNGKGGGEQDQGILQRTPTTFALHQNNPNPFNPTTLITYQLPFNSSVKLEVYDIRGRKVIDLVNGAVEAGYHTISFDASHLSSGMYVYRLEAISSGDGGERFTDSKKMVLVR